MAATTFPHADAGTRSDPAAGQFAMACSVAVFVAYSLVLGVAHDLSPWDAALGGAANALPTVAFAIIAFRTVARRLVGRGTPALAAGHALLAVAYALGTY